MPASPRTAWGSRLDLPPGLEVIHQPQRLRLMALLFKHRDIAFTTTRDLLGLTDGNLASHATRLEQAGCLRARKVLLRDGFELRYRITPEGSAAFQAYLAVLREFLQGQPRET